MREGTKADNNKAPIYNMLKQFALALDEVAKCSQYGHEKYEHAEDDWDNFSRLDNAYARYSNALSRHLIQDGLDESGLDHDAHVAWNSLARLEVKLRKLKKEKENESE